MVDYDARLPRFVLGDPTRLRQVLLNLLNNAVKFTERGSITLRVRDVGGEIGAADAARWAEVRFTVTDTGIGMTPAQRQGLFQPFVQADASMTRRFGGTGLGLAICRRIVEAMGGNIRVDSDFGQGSIFWFDLTLERVEAAEERLSVDLNCEPCIPALNILFAEDNDVNRTLISAVLARRGHYVTAVCDGRQAVELISRRPAEFDIGLFDIQMPVMDGMAAAAEVRAGSSRDMPLVALTADVLPDSQRLHLDAGFDAQAGKPINMTELEAAIRHALASRRPWAVRHRGAEGGGVPHGNGGGDHPVGREDVFDPKVHADLEKSIGAQPLRDLIVRLPASLEADLARLEHAWETGDLKAVGERAHSIKGAACNFGAITVQDAAWKIEKATGSGRSPDPADVERLIRVIEDLAADVTLRWPEA